MNKLLINLLKAYQYAISPLLGRNCRYFPSCSDYAVEAVEKHGAMKGSWLSAKRVCRCHPWHPGGYDPVP
jgi:putative membrane protein insertion efficiency factor